jgi:serine/threonine protein kinase
LLDEFKRLVLLDLGVLRPIAGSTLTDANGIQAFVGTLQYSSPEFLLRQEEESLDGWRSLTFYQIGGVLHDLIMRRLHLRLNAFKIALVDGFRATSKRQRLCFLVQPLTLRLTN